MQLKKLRSQRGVAPNGRGARFGLVSRVSAVPDRKEPIQGLVSDPIATSRATGPILIGADGGVAATTRRAAQGAGAAGSAAAGPILIGADGAAMTRRAALMAASFAAVACPCCEALASGGAVFEYGSLSGPQAWGGVCRTGARQSPIDVPRKALAASLKARGSGAGAGACRPAQLNTSGYKAVKPTILNTGVGTMQVRAGARRSARRGARCGPGATRAGRRPRVEGEPLTPLHALEAPSPAQPRQTSTPRQHLRLQVNYPKDLLSTTHPPPSSPHPEPPTSPTLTNPS